MSRCNSRRRAAQPVPVAFVAELDWKACRVGVFPGEKEVCSLRHRLGNPPGFAQTPPAAEPRKPNVPRCAGDDAEGHCQANAALRDVATGSGLA